MAGTQFARALAGVPTASADLLYACGYVCSDPVAWFRIRGRSFLLVNDLEVAGARKRARVGSVLRQSRYQEILRRGGSPRPDLWQVLGRALRDHGAIGVEVPRVFPAAGVQRLAEAGLRVRLGGDPFFPRRSRKTAREVRLIEEALRAAEAGLAAAVLTLAASRIGGDGRLHLAGKRLTAERVREEAERAMFAAGATPERSIVAGGPPGADPHERGEGPLPAHRPIVLDFFPRSRSSGYYADITRTVVKGKADEMTRAAFLAVRRSQEIALAMIRPGIDGSRIHRRVGAFFAEAGFPLRRGKPSPEGFIHGTGHGLGLELHEPPGIGYRPERLEAGQVITVEPGLYYRRMGGIRLEDVVRVTPQGHRRLTRFPIFLEIP